MEEQVFKNANINEWNILLEVSAEFDYVPEIDEVDYEYIDTSKEYSQEILDALITKYEGWDYPQLMSEHRDILIAIVKQIGT